MTLTAEQSSNKARYEAATTAEIIDIIRIAMGEGCIRPCHVYDAVDELICRIQALGKSPKRNCDVGTAEEQLKRWRKFCGNFHDCVDCPANKEDGIISAICFANWAQMPYDAEEGGAE